MEKTPKHFIVILCGGTGPRLWPLSRTDNPKQFLPILSPKSLLQQTIKRCQKIVPSSQIFLITNQKYFTKTRQHISKKIPTQNIIAEPFKKNTAMAILYATTVIQNINPQSVITALPSDHYITDTSSFKKDINSAARVADAQDTIVVLGTKPSSENPSYGYISTKNGPSPFPPAAQVTRFIEKPSPAKIPQLIKLGYYWNMGAYTFKPSCLIQEFAKYQPKYANIYLKLKDSLKKPNIIKKLYQQAPKLPIDIAISQPSKRLTLIPANFNWSDVGEWKTIYLESKKDKNGFAILNKHTLHNQFESQNCLVRGQKNKLIGLVGVKDLAIIDTPDALLVCKIQKSFNVRDLISRIVQNKKHKPFFVAKNDK